MDASSTSEENNKKSVEIKGTHNRYHMKKLLGTVSQEKKKRLIKQDNIPKEYWTFETQWQWIQGEEEQEDPENPMNKFLNQEMERKLSSYKQQDKEKALDKSLSVISLDKVKELLKESEMKCFYCAEPVFVLYETVRENKQWTLDRVDNDMGHTETNVVIACLECNLQRRRTHQTKFLFTKQLKIVKQQPSP